MKESQTYLDNKGKICFHITELLVLVEVQPLKEEGDANRARMETDYQNEAGESRGNQRSR